MRRLGCRATGVARRLRADERTPTDARRRKWVRHATVIRNLRVAVTRCPRVTAVHVNLVTTSHNFRLTCTISASSLRSTTAVNPILYPPRHPCARTCHVMSIACKPGWTREEPQSQMRWVGIQSRLHRWRERGLLRPTHNDCFTRDIILFVPNPLKSETVPPRSPNNARSRRRVCQWKTLIPGTHMKPYRSEQIFESWMKLWSGHLAFCEIDFDLFRFSLSRFDCSYSSPSPRITWKSAPHSRRPSAFECLAEATSETHWPKRPPSMW
jgi:hypothetical protein